MDFRDTNVKTADGRNLKVRESGDLSGFPVIYHHGTPSSRLLYEKWMEDAQRRGIRLIAYDRPGYGGSDPKPGRNAADVAGDIEAIADGLGFERFATWGASGGGPHVLATAALLPDRVVAAASLASIAPYPAEGLDWFDGMGEGNIEELGKALEGRAALVAFLEAEAKAILESESGETETLKTLLSPPDKAVLTGELAEFFNQSDREALSRGIDGWLDDDFVFIQPWGFELGDIGVPLLLWQGLQDRFVPPAHGKWLAARIPGVDARLSEDDGHLTLGVTRVSETHEWLLSRA